MHVLICTLYTGRLDHIVVLCSFTIPISNGNLSLCQLWRILNFFSFVTGENVMAAAKIRLQILTTCLSLYVTTYQTKQSQRAATNVLELGGVGETRKNPKSCESRMDKQWITKNTDKAAAKGLARLLAVSDGEMWHKNPSVIELGQP